MSNKRKSHNYSILFIASKIVSKLVINSAGSESISTLPNSFRIARSERAL